MIQFYSEKDLASFVGLKQLGTHILKNFKNRTRKKCDIPKREIIFRSKPFSAFGSMSALDSSRNLFINKTATLVTEEKPSVQSLVNVFSSKSGKPICVMDGAYITNIKCAAISAIVTEHCAPEHFQSLGVIGSSVQAYWQVLGILSRSQPAQIIVYSRSKKNCERMIDSLKNHTGAHIHYSIVSSPEEVGKKSQVIVTATTSVEPFFTDPNQLDSCVHLNCMGAHSTGSREVSQGLLRKVCTFVEDRKTAIAEAGDGHDKAFELEELFQIDRKSLRSTQTVFSSTGHAYLDLLTVDYLLQNLNKIT